MNKEIYQPATLRQLDIAHLILKRLRMPNNIKLLVVKRDGDFVYTAGKYGDLTCFGAAKCSYTDTFKINVGFAVAFRRMMDNRQIDDILITKAISSLTRYKKSSIGIMTHEHTSRRLYL